MFQCHKTQGILRPCPANCVIETKFTNRYPIISKQILKCIRRDQLAILSGIKQPHHGI